jgi:hypothetical protein
MIGEIRSADPGNARVPRVTSSPFDRSMVVGVWMVDGAVEPGWKRTDSTAETPVSAGGVGASSVESVRVLAFGEGARGLGERGYGRGRPLGHGDRSRR